MDVVSWPKDNSNAITKDHKVCTFDDVQNIVQIYRGSISI